jgi:hypothetical protein
VENFCWTFKENQFKIPLQKNSISRNQIDGN